MTPALFPSVALRRPAPNEAPERVYRPLPCGCSVPVRLDRDGVEHVGGVRRRVGCGVAAGQHFRGVS